MNGKLALWIGFLGAPLIWLTSFEARFALAPWACTFQSKLALFAVGISALVLCGACGALAWKQWKVLGERGPDRDSGALPLSRFMAILAIFISCGCALLVVAQTIPELLLGACE
jgi:hypothetical protein